jgi:hypothetical protein
MACTIASLILVAMFGVIAAAGLVERASLKGSSPARQDGSPAPSRPWSFPGAWWARMSTR